MWWVVYIGIGVVGGVIGGIYVVTNHHGEAKALEKEYGGKAVSVDEPPDTNTQKRYRRFGLFFDIRQRRN